MKVILIIGLIYICLELRLIRNYLEYIIEYLKNK